MRRYGRRSSAAIKPILARSKSLWIEGNPYYERVEGVVAGTPSLAVYDVILDAGSSAKEDPASAVPFDLRLADGRVLRKPGISSTSPRACSGARGPSTWPGASRWTSTATARSSSARRCPMRPCSRPRRTPSRCTPASSTAPPRRGILTAPDAFTAVVVMVPTMSEYFGQWKVSRFVLGDRARGDSFNVVSRLSESATSSAASASSTGNPAGDRDGGRPAGSPDERGLDRLWSFVSQLRKQETAGGASRPSRPTRSDVRRRSGQPQSPAR